ncbi:hypothetical protein Adt_27890 [Abeliophyllum distichum]|uniref:Uncharacterized protein n=1 Tax=Abeliophyllum distichum TaxID=126358 RepID=A0ABD1RX43_9LAMI
MKEQKECKWFLKVRTRTKKNTSFFFPFSAQIFSNSSSKEKPFFSERGLEKIRLNSGGEMENGRRPRIELQRMAVRQRSERTRGREPVNQRRTGLKNGLGISHLGFTCSWAGLLGAGELYWIFN